MMTEPWRDQRRRAPRNPRPSRGSSSLTSGQPDGQSGRHFLLRRRLLKDRRLPGASTASTVSELVSECGTTKVPTNAKMAEEARSAWLRETLENDES